MSARKLKVSVAGSQSTQPYKCRAVTWEQLTGFLRSRPPATKKDNGNFVGGWFADNYRNGANLRGRDVLTLDADKAEPGLLNAAVLALDCAFYGYSTWSHDPEAGVYKYRLCAPLNRTVDRNEYWRIAWAVMTELGAEQFDSTHAQAERLMHLPANREGAELVEHEGDPLDADYWLAVADGLKIADRPEPASAVVVDRGDVEAWLSALPEGTCPVVEKQKSILLTIDAPGTGTNDDVMRAQRAIAHMGAAGHLGVAEALEAGEEAWALAGRAEGDWWRLLRGAVGMALADEDEDHDLTCCSGESDFDIVVCEACEMLGVNCFEHGGVGATDEPAEQEREVPTRRLTGKGGSLLAENAALEVTDRLEIAVDSHDEKLLWVWENGVWTPGNRPVRVLLCELLRNAFRTSHLETTQTALALQRGVKRISAEPVSAYINVRNGLLNWRTEELLPHDPAVLSTVQLPVRWDAEPAGGREVQSFLAGVLAADMLEPTEGGPGYIWELLGYLTMSGNPLQSAILLRGDGGNGKGVFLRMLGELLGTENVSSVTLSDLATNRFRAAGMYGKLANIAGDIDHSRLTSTALFKGMTGEDYIDAERKFGNAFSFKPWAVPVYSANRFFTASDSSEGYFRRWQVLPFDQSFIGREDRNIDARLARPEELEWLLWKAVQGLQALMRRGRLPEVDSVVEAGKAFARASDSVRDWIDEHCEVDELNTPAAAARWIGRQELLLAYEISMSMGGERGRLSARELYARLVLINGIKAHKRNGERGFLGLTLKAAVREATV